MANLITLSEYKSYKAIGNTTKDDAIQLVISSVSDLIKAYCGRTFIDHYTVPKTELISVNDGVDTIILSEHPIRLISSFLYNGSDISSLIEIDTELGFIHYSRGFARGYDVIHISYTGGYSETPSDIKLAAFELVDYYMSGEHKSRKSFEGTSIEYKTVPDTWPFHIKGILDMHRNV